MPQPSPSDVHVDAILTTMSVAYMQSAANFIADRVFPSVTVDKQSDKYFVYTKGDWFRDEAEKRAPATESAGGGWNVSTASYSCDVYAFHKDIDDQTRANADAPLNIDREATEFVTQRLLLRKELDWTNTYFKTGVWGTDVVGGTDFTAWDNYASSDPIDDVETGKETILGETGFMPNTLVMGYQTLRQLRHHPDIVDRMKYTGRDVASEQILSQLFGVDRILVSRAIYNSAAEGATDSFGFVNGKNALLCYVPASAGLLTPAAGYTFAWRGVSDGLGQNVGISRIPNRLTRSERIEGQQAWVHKVISTDLGYFFSGTVS